MHTDRLCDAEPRTAHRLVMAAIFGLPPAIILVVGVLPFLVKGYVLRSELWRRPAGGAAAAGGPEERLPESGASIGSRDRLALVIEGREPLWAYCFLVDGAGRQFTLLPDPRLGAANPLAPGKAHRFSDADLGGESGDGVRSEESAAAGWLPAEPGPSVFIYLFIDRRPIPECESLVPKLSPAAVAGATPVGPDPRAPDAQLGALKTIQAYNTVYKKLRRRGDVIARRFALTVRPAG